MDPGFRRGGDEFLPRELIAISSSGPGLKILLTLSAAKRSRRAQADFATLQQHHESFDFAQDEVTKKKAVPPNAPHGWTGQRTKGTVIIATVISFDRLVVALCLDTAGASIALCFSYNR